MTEVGDRPVVAYYSDLLCVWAWIGQPRLEEVTARWSDRVTVQPRCVDVFGDAHGKIRRKWGTENGFERFADHVQEAGRNHAHAGLHPDLWRGVRPTGSLPAHLAVKAAEITGSADRAANFARDLREAFFVEGRDISNQAVLKAVAAATGLDGSAMDEALSSGRAQAALAADLELARAGRIAGSPTWAMNDGRQVLYGNVGYRIIEANLEEYLREDRGDASWC